MAYTSVETMHSTPTNAELMFSKPPCQMFTSSGSHRMGGLMYDFGFTGGFGGAVASTAHCRSGSEMSNP